MINSIRRNQPRLLRLKLERRRQEILLCLPLAQRAKQLQLEMKFTRNRKEKAFTIKGECIKQEYNSASGRGSKFDSISYFISMNDWPPLDIYFSPISFFFSPDCTKSCPRQIISLPKQQGLEMEQDIKIKKESQTIEIQQTRQGKLPLLSYLWLCRYERIGDNSALIYEFSHHS